MTRWLALVASELRQRRLLLAGSGLLGLLVFAAPALPALGGHDPAEVRSATAFFILVLWTPLLALAAGATAIGGEMADRRIGFYLARPVSSWTVWGGKLGAAALLPLLAGFLVLLPASLAGGVFSVTGSPAARFADLPLPRWWAAVLGVLLLVALGHAAGIALRSRSVWLLLDLGAVALAAGLVVEAVRTLDRSFLEDAIAAGGLGFAGVALAALLAAGGLAVHRGRTDLAAAHRTLALALWPVVLAGAVCFVLFSRWVIGAPIESLAGGGAAWSPPGAGPWVVVRGEAEHRFGFETSFLFDSRSGRAVRLGHGWTASTAASADGSRAAWLILEGREWQLRSLDLRAPAARPRRSPVGFSGWPGDLVLSPHGGRLATLTEDRLLVHDLDSGRLLAAPSVATPYLGARLAFLDEERLRLVVLRHDGHRIWLEVQDLAAAAGRLVARARIEPPGLAGDWRISPGGDRLLVTTAHREGRTAPWLLYDLATGAPAGGPARPAFGAAFLADGRLVVREPAPGGEVLRLVSRDGVEERAFPFAGAHALDLGAQPDAGSLVVAAAGCRTGRIPGYWTAQLLDLASGARRPLGRGLRPLADPPAVGPAARLFRAAGASLVAIDERGEPRTLLPRGAEGR